MKRIKQSLNGLWEYQINGAEMGAVQVPFSRLCVGNSKCILQFDTVDAPHTELCFEGITYEATVVLNGVTLGDMLAYSFYSFDVSRIIKPTGNLLMVELRDMNMPFGPSEGWENQGGIIRDVYLQYSNLVRIEDTVWRTGFRKDLHTADAEVQVSVAGGDGEVNVVLENDQGVVVAKGQQSSVKGKAVFSYCVDHPKLWSPQMPALYTLHVSVADDMLSQKVGFKKLEIIGRHFYLNGEKLFLRGICRHDLWGDQGHTMSEEQMLRDMRMIKALGCNYVRLVHYPHHRRVVEIADEIGLLVSQEPGLWWSDIADTRVTEGALEVLKRVVIRDRNRCSVAFWLAFNECDFTNAYLRQSSDLCKELDPTRFVSGANVMNIDDTKTLFSKFGFDFYTYHPYGPDPGLVQAGLGAKTRHIPMDDVMRTLDDKPLVFTEWGGMPVYDNRGLFRLFLEKMLDAENGDANGNTLAGCAYWVFADIHEFNRGEPACRQGILHEGLVDVYRNPHEMMNVFSALMNGARTMPEQASYFTPAGMRCAHQSCEPLDLKDLKSDPQQEKAWYTLSEKAAKAQGLSQKPFRRLQLGPVLPKPVKELGGINADLDTGKPLIVRGKIIVPVNKRVSALVFFGQTSIPEGYPAYGAYGELAAEYILKYADGSSRHIPVRNGQEFTTALGLHGPSRIHPVAENAAPVARFGYDVNWEHYVMNMFEVQANPDLLLVSVTLKAVSQDYSLLLYGISIAVK